MRLLWENETNRDSSQHYILKRQTLALRPFMPLHSHDYSEMVYVERGSAEHVANGTRSKVGKGDMIFLRAEVDEHCFEKVDRSLSLLQILIERQSIAFITGRYGASVNEFLNVSPTCILRKLDPMQQIWFERSFNSLLVNQGSLIDIERFLLNFVGLFSLGDGPRDHGTVSWMDKAFREIQEPRHFQRGVTGFVELCNRSGEHVEREVKKRTGHTITDVVNQSRMAWASYMLIYSDLEIIDIAGGCGFESISRFYKVFRDHFGVPPAAYRRKMRETDQGNSVFASYPRMTWEG